MDRSESRIERVVISDVFNQAVHPFKLEGVVRCHGEIVAIGVNSIYFCQVLKNGEKTTYKSCATC